MEKDRRKWNEKYEKHDYPSKPSQILKDFYRYAKPGRALDLAAGMGRNACFLAQNGFEVDAVDISDVAVGHLKNRFQNLHSINADLDDFDIPKESYNLIVNIRFLNRNLFPKLVAGLVPGGMIIFETYLVGGKPAEEGPSCKDYFLQPNELLKAFSDLRIVFYQEFSVGEDKGRALASLVGIKDAGKGGVPAPRLG